MHCSHPPAGCTSAEKKKTCLYKIYFYDARWILAVINDVVLLDVSGTHKTLLYTAHWGSIDQA